jgi:hypothetical protein
MQLNKPRTESRYRVASQNPSQSEWYAVHPPIADLPQALAKSHVRSDVVLEIGTGPATGIVTESLPGHSNSPKLQTAAL